VSAIGCDTHGLFEMFTEQAREAIGRAQQEAREMGHESVQVEHLLLGLFSDQAGIPGGVFADFGLRVEPVRGLVRERFGAASSSLPEGRLPFSPEAKEALRSANRIGMGTPAAEHMLIVIVRHGEGGACEILSALGADPHRIRFETKKRAWPSSFPESGVRPTAEVRLVRSVPLESLSELDFGD
jgi:ATP-dependent Clp protease ATP-binding subunit ClpA